MQAVGGPLAETEAAGPGPRAPAISGCADGLEGGVLHGWAYDAAEPDALLAIEVRLDGRIVGSGTADLLRDDLRALGIGQGDHAFRIHVQADPAERPRLQVMARRPSGGDPVPIAWRSPPEPAEAVAPEPEVLQAVDALAVESRQLQGTVRAALRGVVEAVQTTSQADAIGEIRKTLAELGDAQAEMRAQLGAIEVFLLRFDSTLRDMDATLKTRVPNRSRRGVIAILMIGLLVSLAALAAAVIQA